MGIRRQLFNASEVRPIQVDGTNYTKAAGTGTYVSAPIDTQGYDSVAILTLFGAGTATSVVTQTLQDGNAANLSDAQNIITQFGASTATATQTYTVPGGGYSVSELGWDVYSPQKRYLQVTTVIGTANSVVLGQIAILFNAKQQPVTQNTAFYVTPVELNSPADATTP